MNKNCLLICLLIGFFCTLSLEGQTDPARAPQMTLYQSAHYEVEASVTLPAADVEALVHKLEADYTLFNEMFTSPSQRPESLLHVKIYASKEEFNQALAAQKVYNRNNYIYFYYGDPAQNVLIIYPLKNEAEERAQLARHSFFSYAFDSTPTLPAWLREGLALYYESLIYEEDGTAIVPYNHLYLDDLKKAAAEGPLNLRELMMLTDESGKFEKGQFEKNLLYSWGIVNYFMFSDNESDRMIIGQAVALASKENSQTENSQAVMDFIFSKKPDLETAFANFLESQMGYIETLNAMRTAYLERNFERAKSYAETALQTKPEAYLPVYYLGLIAFENKNYEEAKAYYQNASELGAPKPLIDFAMGYVYYYGEKNYSEAAAAFRRAKTEDAARYGQKVDMLLQILEQDSQSPYAKSDAKKPQKTTATNPVSENNTPSTNTDVNPAAEESQETPQPEEEPDMSAVE